MERIQRQLLEAVKAMLGGRNPADLLEPADWGDFFALCQSQRLLPVVYSGIRVLPSFLALEEREREFWRRQAIGLSLTQYRKTLELLRLLAVLEENGERYLLVKGLSCRVTYPEPDARCSGDEDLVSLPEEEAVVRERFSRLGYTLLSDDGKGESVWEGKEGLRVELHCAEAFPLGERFSQINRYFSQSFSHRFLCRDGEDVFFTFPPTGQALYLICHAFQHFVHSGVGVRQLADLCLYAGAWEGQICWEEVFFFLGTAKADVFAAGMLKGAEEFLGFIPKGSLKRILAQYQVSGKGLIEDMLEGGVYGQNSLPRRQSAGITLNAAKYQRKNFLISSLFPPASQLEKRYPFLKKHPLLLPAAWIRRWSEYLVDSGRSPSKSVEIGKKRLELLREYGVIE